MPQAPLPSVVAKNPSGALVSLSVDANGNLLVSQAASDAQTTLNLTAAAVIKNTAKQVLQVSIISPGTTSGAFTLNDCKTTGAATTANQIWTLPYNSANNIAGQIFTLNLPLSSGLVLSAVPGGGSPQIAVSWL